MADKLNSTQKAKLKQLQQFTTCSDVQGIRALKQTQWEVEGKAFKEFLTT
jgi:hypothetical protein